MRESSLLEVAVSRTAKHRKARNGVNEDRIRKAEGLRAGETEQNPRRHRKAKLIGEVEAAFIKELVGLTDAEMLSSS